MLKRLEGYKMSKYEFTEEMRDVCAFGGDCERDCRKMIIAGVEWLDKNPKANPQFGTLHFVEDEFNKGPLCPRNQDAKELSRAISAVVSDYNLSMKDAMIEHIQFIKDVGWDLYVIVMDSAIGYPCQPDDSKGKQNSFHR